MTQRVIYQDANTFMAKWDRRLLSLFAAAGTAPSTQWTDPLKVQAKGTPTMHLDVLGGDCIIPCVASGGTQFTIDYGAIIYNNDATVDLLISPAHATYGRIDLVVVQLYDDGTAGGSKGVLEVVTGVASGSPAVPATPANAYKLAEIAVAAAVTTITNANITDRRATTAPKRSGGWLTADFANLQITNAKIADATIADAKLAKGGWVAYSPAVTGSTTNPTCNTPVGYYRVYGSTIHCVIRTGAFTNNGSGLYSYGLPAGISIDTTVHPVSTFFNSDGDNATLKDPLGLAIAGAWGGLWQEVSHANVFALSATTVGVAQASTTAGRVVGWGSYINWASVAAHQCLQFQAAIT